MAMVEWNPSFSVGNSQLDSDHRILLDLLTQLYDAMDTGQSREVVGSVITVLAEYVEHHFRREEALMAAAGFPDLDGHREEHHLLEHRVDDLRDRYRAGQRGVLDDEVIELLKKWLTEHILVTDNSYRPWVEKMGGAGFEPAAVAQ